MIYLYIKTHNKTGLKYFGKTEKSDVAKYKGSGSYWQKHIKKHRYDVTTRIYFAHDDIELCRTIALKFSIDYNIEYSEEWANLQVENITCAGNKGNRNGMFGRTHAIEAKAKISKINTSMLVAVNANGEKFKISNTDERYLSGELIAESKGRKASNETKAKLSESKQGCLNSKAKKIGIYNSDNELVYYCHGNFAKTILEHNLPNRKLNWSLANNGAKIYSTSRSLKMMPIEYIDYIGWSARYIKDKG